MDDHLSKTKRNLKLDPENDAEMLKLKSQERKVLDYKIPPCPGCHSRENMVHDVEYEICQEMMALRVGHMPPSIEFFFCESCGFYALRKKIVKEFPISDEEFSKILNNYNYRGHCTRNFLKTLIRQDEAILGILTVLPSLILDYFPGATLNLKENDETTPLFVGILIQENLDVEEELRRLRALDAKLENLYKLSKRILIDIDF